MPIDPGSLLLSIALALIVGAFIARPMVQRQPAAHATPQVEILRAEQEIILTALHELDFDHATGKTAEEDYTPQRAELMARGVALLKQLDDLSTASPEAALEAEVQALRAARRGSTREGAATCPVCQTPYQASDHFCAKCGAALPQPA